MHVAQVSAFLLSLLALPLAQCVPLPQGTTENLSEIMTIYIPVPIGPPGGAGEVISTRVSTAATVVVVQTGGSTTSILGTLTVDPTSSGGVAADLIQTTINGDSAAQTTTALGSSGGGNVALATTSSSSLVAATSDQVADQPTETDGIPIVYTTPASASQNLNAATQVTTSSEQVAAGRLSTTTIRAAAVGVISSVWSGHRHH